MLEIFRPPFCAGRKEPVGMANIPFWIVPCLILWPVAAAAVMPFLRDRRVRSAAVYLAGAA